MTARARAASDRRDAEAVLAASRIGSLSAKSPARFVWLRMSIEKKGGNTTDGNSRR